jgi:hypothetical protein
MEKLVFLLYFFFCFRGGVMGLPVLVPPVTYFCFFSAGFRICSQKISIGRLLDEN